ncbi:hypothetical protein D3C85_374920 [compost metagenome]
MQKPNFPNVLYRVSLSSGQPGEAPVATLTAIPAKFNESTVTTANRRRVALAKLGKIETIAESNTLHIVRVWLANREEVQETVHRMQRFLANSTQKKLEALHNLQLGLIQPATIREREYEDD